MKKESKGASALFKKNNEKPTSPSREQYPFLTTPLMSAKPATSSPASVSIEAAVFALEKRSERTVGEHHAGDVKIYIYGLRSKCQRDATNVGRRFPVSVSCRIRLHEAECSADEASQDVIGEAQFLRSSRSTVNSFSPVQPQVNLKEGHNWMYLVQHGTAFG